ncbi:MAG: ROK family protein, partial [Bryobacteraceae bacterium]
MSFVLAVDFGGTKTALARVDANGSVDHIRRAPAAHTLEQSVAQIAEASSDVSAIGVIVPG